MVSIHAWSLNPWAVPWAIFFAAVPEKPARSTGQKLRCVDRGLNTRRAKSILRQLLAALVTLHSKGLIQGNLHLENVLLPLQAS